MITIDSIEALQAYIKVNADFEVEYIIPFYLGANKHLETLVGGEMFKILEESKDGDYYEASRRFVAVNALCASKGIQNVKLTSSGFTRYSEFAKNVIAASTDAMNLFAADLEKYNDFCTEYVLSVCERSDVFVSSKYSTISTTWLKNVDVLEAYSGIRLSRIEFRKRMPWIKIFTDTLKAKLGGDILDKIFTLTDEPANDAKLIVMQLISSLIANSNYGKTDDYRMLYEGLELILNRNKNLFGIEDFDYGATNSNGFVGL